MEIKSIIIIFLCTKSVICPHLLRNYSTYKHNRVKREAIRNNNHPCGINEVRHGGLCINIAEYLDEIQIDNSTTDAFEPEKSSNTFPTTKNIVTEKNNDKDTEESNSKVNNDYFTKTTVLPVILDLSNVTENFKSKNQPSTGKTFINTEKNTPNFNHNNNIDITKTTASYTFIPTKNVVTEENRDKSTETAHKNITKKYTSNWNHTENNNTHETTLVVTTAKYVPQENYEHSTEIYENNRKNNNIDEKTTMITTISSVVPSNKEKSSEREEELYSSTWTRNDIKKATTPSNSFHETKIGVSEKKYEQSTEEIHTSVSEKTATSSEETSNSDYAKGTILLANTTLERSTSTKPFILDDNNEKSREIKENKTDSNVTSSSPNDSDYNYYWAIFFVLLGLACWLLLIPVVIKLYKLVRDARSSRTKNYKYDIAKTSDINLEN